MALHPEAVAIVKRLIAEGRVGPRPLGVALEVWLAAIAQQEQHLEDDKERRLLLERQLMRDDGSPIWHSTDGTPEPDTEGLVEMMVCVVCGCGPECGGHPQEQFVSVEDWLAAGPVGC